LRVAELRLPNGLIWTLVLRFLGLTVPRVLGTVVLLGLTVPRVRGIVVVLGLTVPRVLGTVVLLGLTASRVRGIVVVLGLTVPRVLGAVVLLEFRGVLTIPEAYGLACLPDKRIPELRALLPLLPLFTATLRLP